MKQIVESDLNDLKAQILQDQTMLKAMPGNVDPEVMNKVLIPKIIRTRYPDISEDEVEEVRQHVVTDSVVKNGEVKEVGDKRFVLMAGKFVNIDDLHIDLIDTVNPFQRAFEILSKSVTKQVLGDPGRDRHDPDRDDRGRGARCSGRRSTRSCARRAGRPRSSSDDPLEQRMAEALLLLQREARAESL